jgi:hypothetical protein
MNTNYESFLRVTEDGHIWWPLEDAIRLGAGYRLYSDDNLTLEPELRATNNRARTNERTLIGAFSDDRLAIERPKTFERDGFRYVEAGGFLDWLSQYITQTKAKITFPKELASGVRNSKALAAASQTSITSQEFQSLTLPLEDWFDRERNDLPEALRKRVEFEFFPVPWDDLSAAQRQSAALQLDYQNDPATELERRKWWDYLGQKNDFEREILHWESVSCPTAGELALKEDRLTQMRKELALMNQQYQLARGDYYPERKSLDAGKEPAPKIDYIAFPKAMKILTDRLGATTEELAAWIFIGPDTGGIAAYRNANEQNPAPRFFFNYTMGTDHLPPLMACWFRKEDITHFEPTDRYITGEALIERWSKQPDLHTEAFIRAKIDESRLSDIRLTFEGTQKYFSDTIFPPLSAGLFVLSKVEQIEAEDFGVDEIRNAVPSDSSLENVDPAKPIVVVSSQNQCAVFIAMTELKAIEITIAFVGDKSEHGIGANNMFEISARGETRRVAIAALGLVNRQRGILNGEGLTLLGMARKEKLTTARKGASAKIKRLRAVLRTHLGICGDPFTNHRKIAGWEPVFKIEDRRGAADDRAKRDAEDYQTASYDQMPERGEMDDDTNELSDSSESALTSADEWMEKSGHNWQESSEAEDFE